MPTFTTIIQRSFGSPSQRNKAREVNKVIQIWKEEVKVSLFADNIILHVENPKDLTKKLLKTNRVNLQHTKSMYKNPLFS